MIFINNKYTKWYNNIIAKSKKRVNQHGYFEKHHIIPKSLGGPNSLDNLVLLTAREHFICHFLLTKMLNPGAERRKMLFACHMLLAGKNRYKVNSRTYETLKKLRLQAYNENKEEIRKKISESNKKRYQENPEIKVKISDKLKGRKLPPRTPEHSKKLSFPKSEETKRKLSESRKGKSWGFKHSDETKRKMSLKSKGRKQPTKICEYCGKKIAIGNYIRWHGENCKKS